MTTRGELFFTDAQGKPQDEGLHQLEPDDSEAYRKASARVARSIGMSEATIEAVYGKDTA